VTVFLYFDPRYILFVLIPALLISGGVQLYLKSTFAKWRQVRNSAGLTGEQVADTLFERGALIPVATERSGKRIPLLQRIPIQRSQAGALSDHFDPRANVVRLSEPIATQPSVASMAVVAHELGHVQQAQQRSPLMTARNVLVPAVTISPMVSYGLIVIGFLFGSTGLVWLGVLVFALVVLFAVLTLPVEINASRRGLRLLHETGLMQTESDAQGSRAVLTAAGLTYVGAAVTAVLQLLYFVMLAGRRG
jgi:Zn-dependent membrane protease YugP